MTCRSLRQLLSICGFAVILAACGVKNTERGIDPHSLDMAIRNGEVVTTPAVGNNPDNPAEYVMMIITQNGGPCTGSLISRRIILTAAHCLVGVTHPSQIGISFGLKMAASGVPVEDFRAHEGYNPRTKENDIAIIELKVDAPKNYRMLELPRNLIFPYEVKYTAVGYGVIHGRYDDHDAKSGILRKTEMTLFMNDKNQGQSFSVNQVQKGTCFGDSGGPAIFRYIGRYYVIGVMSYIAGMPSKEMILESQRLQDPDLWRPKFPNYDACIGQGYYANVKYHLAWINKAASEVLSLPAPPPEENE